MSIQRVMEMLFTGAGDGENPIVVLGKVYEPLAQVDQQQQQQQQQQQFFLFKKEPAWPADFTSDVCSRLWFTYRTGFAPLLRDDGGPSPLSLGSLLRGQKLDLHADHFTTDCGWGCMIRTGQSMLGNCLLELALGRDWRWEAARDEQHDRIVGWFADTPEAPFSIHNVVEQGRALSGKKTGEWFGPSATARSIQALCTRFDCGVQVYIGSDSGDIYEQDMFKLMENEDFKPTLVLLGVRLGIDSVNPVYWPSLKDLLSSSESVGIAGGRPSSSHYFYGYQGDYLFYLDPHIPQLALSTHDLAVDSVHTSKIRKIHISEIDPSMLLGFLIKTQQEWDSWKRKIQNPENKNKIVHISPDENPDTLPRRKPSFVEYEDDDGFVDVDLEYDNLPIAEEPIESSMEPDQEEPVEVSSIKQEEPVVVEQADALEQWEED